MSHLIGPGMAIIAVALVMAPDCVLPGGGVGQYFGKHDQALIAVDPLPAPEAVKKVAARARAEVECAWTNR